MGIQNNGAVLFDINGNYIGSSDNPININQTVSKDLEGGGKVSVGTTAVEVSFSSTPKSIIITADHENTGILFVGKSDVVSDGSNSITFLKSGDSVTIDYNDVTNAIYIVADAASQNFFKGAIF